MSAELLRRLRESKAFDPTPTPDRMSQVHDPFDSLTDSAGGEYEQRFVDVVLRRERVALVGASGSGKSSITEFVLNGPQAENVAALRIRLGMQTDSLISDPAEFPRLLVNTCVIAVHDEYVSNPHYERAREFLDTRITLPTLADHRMLGRIVTKRARNAVEDLSIILCGRPHGAVAPRCTAPRATSSTVRATEHD